MEKIMKISIKSPINVTAHLDFVQRWFSGLVDVAASQPKRGLIVDSRGRRWTFHWAGILSPDDERIDPHIAYYPVAAFNGINRFVLNPEWMRMTKQFTSDDSIHSYEDIMRKSSILTVEYGANKNEKGTTEKMMLPATMLRTLENSAGKLLDKMWQVGLIHFYEGYLGMGSTIGGDVKLFYETDEDIEWVQVPFRLLLHPEEHLSYVAQKHQEYLKYKEEEAARIAAAQEEAERRQYEQLRKKFEK